MSAYDIEVKILASLRAIQPGQHHQFWADNVTGTATSSWANAAAADAFEETGSEVFLIVYNAGDDAIAVASDDAASPARYHVVAPGTQRDIQHIKGKPVKVKTL